MKQMDYKNNRSELMARIRKDYNLPEDDPVVDAILLSAAIVIDRGFMEAKPLFEKYHDLICPWCGKLHYRSSCEKEMKKSD